MSPYGSAEQSTNTLLVTWPAHNLLIAWLASPHRHFYSIFHTLLHFHQYFYVWVCPCLNLYLSPYVYFYVFINLQSFRPCVPPHGSAEQSTNTVLVTWPARYFLISDCMTCLTSQIILSLFPTNNCLFASSFIPQFDHTSICFILPSFPSQCALISSAELSTSLSNRSHFCPAPYLHLKHQEHPLV